MALGREPIKIGYKIGHKTQGKNWLRPETTKTGHMAQAKNWSRDKNVLSLLYRSHQWMLKPPKLFIKQTFKSNTLLIIIYYL